MLLANENTYRKLSTFQSVEEMNEAIKAHRQAHKLSETERAVLDLISRYSCKYVGVSFLSKNKIAEAVGRVRRTVIRVCNRLEALGIIKQYETKRDGGDCRQSTNVIVVQAAKPVINYDEVGATCHGSEHVQNLHEVDHLRNSQEQSNVSPIGETLSDDLTKCQNGNINEVAPDMSRHKAPSNKLNNNTYKETPSSDSIIKRGLKHAIPAPIYDALAPFLGGQELYDTYGILLRAKASVDRSITLETHGQAYVDAFMNVVRLYKAGKVRKSFNGLLYSAWQSVTATIKRRISADKHPVLYDWLAE